jgi:flagellar biosynthesis chaperone FliJ
MAVSRALRRLLRVLEIEEEQSRLALETSVGELGTLERSLTATRVRERSGRRLVISSAQSGELPDRLAGLEETRAASRRAVVLVPRIADAHAEAAALREAFLAKRVERRQAETLVRETEARDATISGRRSQQALDDWYLNRMHARKRTTQPEEPATSGEAPDGTRLAANET